MASAELVQWAVPALKSLLPLDDDSLMEVINYAASMPPSAAAEHFEGLLGDGPPVLEFVASFNMRRLGNHRKQPETRGPSPGERPQRSTKGRAKKEKKPLHTLPARQIEAGEPGYRKSELEDYMKGSAKQNKQDKTSQNLTLKTLPPAQADKAPPSAAGPLLEDLRSKPRPASLARHPRAIKVNISGGLAMRGASTTLDDLDSAIKSLEMQTNPLLTDTDDQKRKCQCMATNHPLLEIAPNCLGCGQIICVKQGLGPCTFCHAPLLAREDLARVLKILKAERGAERQRVTNAAFKKAELITSEPRMYSGRKQNMYTPSGSDDESLARAHRDRLLSYQANNTRRTRIHDEAADFEIPSSGTNMWASPAEKAQQILRQQQLLREMEWHARPGHEKRKIVASIDVTSGKVVKTIQELRMDERLEDQPVAPEEPSLENASMSKGSNNPLASILIRPETKEKGEKKQSPQVWRKVQDDDHEGSPEPSDAPTTPA
ncbi:zf-C2HC5-domain-containing protein [Piedraia hortae CBS 480.64]|uniref:Zf-C2HC5-domain-containing protein n=1 Tax=Piedraia hortae CBS 480.64 TaxID=1314780 RepID=A0A6A7BQQ0_9PEZI|nr:zf-C2HC5-domain-containing protein [Piedraia hortae CBS 480.64]